MSVEVKAARERSGYPPSLAVAIKIEGANTSIPDGPFSSGYGFFTYLATMFVLIGSFSSKLLKSRDLLSCEHDA